MQRLKAVPLIVDYESGNNVSINGSRLEYVYESYGINEEDLSSLKTLNAKHKLDIFDYLKVKCGYVLETTICEKRNNYGTVLRKKVSMSPPRVPKTFMIKG